MLRALFVSIIIVYGILLSFRGPFYALLFYLWIAYFRPEFWLWSDFVSQLNLSFIVGVAVLVATLFSRDKIRLGVGPSLWLLFLAQSLLATLLSPHFNYAWPFWQDFAKSTVMSLMIVTLVSDERRLHQVFVVIAASLGLEAVKQGWAQLLLNPGGQNFNDHPVLGDNNGVAVGMFMLTSILVGLARTAPEKYVRLVTRFATIGVVYRGITTYSRGGFLACGAFGLQYLARSERKLAGAFAIAFTCLLVVPVLPDAFWDRMNTITTANEDVEGADASVRGRLHFWRVATDMAIAHPFFGVGHNAYVASYNEYDFSNGEFSENRSVHSSWFGVLAELGFPGLILFVGGVGYAFWVCARAQRLAKSWPELERLRKYAVAIEGALVAFCVGGSFVIFQYTEMLWHTMALAIVVDRLVRQRVAELGRQSVPQMAALDPARAIAWGGATLISSRRL